MYLWLSKVSLRIYTLVSRLWRHRCLLCSAFYPFKKIFFLFLLLGHRHRHIWPGLPGQGQEEQVLLRIEADEDPRRDPAKARAARPQREGGPDGGQPPFPHPAVSVWERVRGQHPTFPNKVTGGCLCILTSSPLWPVETILISPQLHN